jgi:threonine dehydrogenase-like Zn-dependent dehydrogenase
MRRLIELVQHGRVDLRPLLTHTFLLDNITEAYELFASRRDGVLRVAIRPQVHRRESTKTKGRGEEDDSTG